MSDITVCALYRFVGLDDFKEMRAPLLDFLNAHQIRGTLLLASEGINGTVSGSPEAIAALKDRFAQDKRLAGMTYKESVVDRQPFYRTKVKLKKEIVTLGVSSVDPRKDVGQYVEPEHWNDLISDPDVVLIDTRNDYEVSLGTFRGALNPNTATFRDFPEFVEAHLDPKQHRKVAMFCTGGIRCEKSTAFLKQQGFDEVYHLRGGILNYFDKVPASESLWEGECFVFDNRVTVNHALLPGTYRLCAACRMPLSAEDRRSIDFVSGVSCPHCLREKSIEQRTRYAERQRQMELAAARGEAHIGHDVVQTITERRMEKQQRREAQRRQDQQLTNA